MYGIQAEEYGDDRVRTHCTLGPVPAKPQEREIAACAPSVQFSSHETLRALVRFDRMWTNGRSPLPRDDGVILRGLPCAAGGVASGRSKWH